MHWLIDPFKKYAVWTGRATRSEYWYFSLFTFLITIGLAVIDTVLGTVDETTGQGVLGILWSLFIFLPTLAVFVRRLHDTGRSGWWFWIALIPLIGVIVLLVFMCIDSQSEANQYGDNPKQGAAPIGIES